jgi:hypothetical protein
MGADVVREHGQRPVDVVLELGRALPDLAQQPPQGLEALVDQGQAQRLDRVEVTIERGRHHTDLLGDLAQGDRDETGAVGQLEGGIQDGAAGALLALAAGLAHLALSPGHTCDRRLAA